MDEKNDIITDFDQYRARMNKRILSSEHLGLKRFFALDSRAYEEGGALPVKTKEMLGLVASTVLRCNDCITYHVLQLVRECGIAEAEFYDCMNISLVVGGSITIPHIRRAFEVFDEAMSKKGRKSSLIRFLVENESLD